jgi:response regulator RpfG family c-di-GMP phosphodiesterase
MTSTLDSRSHIPDRAAEAVGASTARKAGGVRRGTIVVVDDEIDAREALSDALRDEGYEVFLAANGQQGLLLLRRLASPLGVILDVTMPVMSGVERESR